MVKVKEVVKISAKHGYVFKSKLDGAILSNTLILGINDTIDNYEEVKEEADEES